MFGRLFIRGQRDRLAVSAALGHPPKPVAQACHRWLTRLRKTLKEGGEIHPLFEERVADVAMNALELARDKLIRAGFVASAEPFRD